MNLIPLALTLLAIFLGSLIVNFETGLLFGIVVALIALQRETHLKVVSLQDQIRNLSEDGKSSAAVQSPTSDLDPTSSAAKTEESHSNRPVEIHAEHELSLVVEFPKPDSNSAENQSASVTNFPGNPVVAPPTANPFDRFLNRVKDVIWSYFTDGNIFVRIGLLILFFGVAFLLKYAAENPRIPIEYRFLGAAAGGLGLLIFGWRLRLSRPVYALLLQGGGIGIIYITIFASFRIAGLLPPTLTFILLAAFAAITAALAVLQNSRALAIYAVLGGFLAPFLASSGSGNYIGLFSYYAALNAAVFAIAWFKSWRLLNLLGFVFTFAVFSLWVIFSYKTSMMIPAVGFLLLFFAMYSLIGILYAIQQTVELKGIVDGTLVFGTPVVASSLLMAMIRHLDYGIAIAASGIGIYYVLLAKMLWSRSGEALRLLAEAMLAIGVVFATLAIPYSLDGHWTSATWALEAAGILWISIRQQRQYAQWFAIALQFGAGILFLWRNVGDIGDIAWINPAFLGGVFVALGAFISARLLYKLEAENNLHPLHNAFFIWAMCWWLGSALIQIDAYILNQTIAWLLLFTLTASVLVYLDRVKGWNWMPASISAALLLPILVLISLNSINHHQHVLLLPDAIVWVLAWIMTYRIIVRLEEAAWPEWINLLLHSGFVLYVVCLLSLEVLWQFEQALPSGGQGYIALLTIIPLLSIYAARTVKFPAILRFGMPLQLGIIAPLALLLSLWCIAANFTNTADPAPLPYLPIVNPIDLAHLVFFISILRVLVLFQPPPMASYRNHVMVMLGALIFVWISAVLLRSLHHYLDIPFDLLSLYRDTTIQTSLSILWTLIGMLAMLHASRRQLRPIWIAGAILIAVVLTKMIIIDLDARGTVERIVSFMAVGGLLVAMGYFSPIPPKHDRVDEATAEAHHAG